MTLLSFVSTAQWDRAFEFEVLEEWLSIHLILVTSYLFHISYV